MGIEQKILVRARGLAALVATAGLLMACGQKGNLYLPNTDPDFQERATLPELVRRQIPGAAPASLPASAAGNSAAPKPASSAPAGR